MAKRLRKRMRLGQNFLHCPQLAHAPVQESSIGLGDVIYEIGPGRGILTHELAQAARRVFADEKDPALASVLQKRFQRVHNVEIINGDFLRHHVRACDYKIFANIPYNITAELVRKILYAAPTPIEACLIMQKEAAHKFAGAPRETQFSLLAKAQFELEIIRALQRADFDPAPSVDSVLLRIQKRANPLIPQKDRSLYGKFVQFGFGGYKRSLRLTYKAVFTYRQWRQLASNLDFPLNATPSELSFAQWMGLFDCFKKRVTREKQAQIRCAVGH